MEPSHVSVIANAGRMNEHGTSYMCNSSVSCWHVAFTVGSSPKMSARRQLTLAVGSFLRCVEYC